MKTNGALNMMISCLAWASGGWDLGVYNGEVSPIGFPCSNPFLGHLSEVGYWDRLMFDLAKHKQDYIPIVLIVYVS